MVQNEFNKHCLRLFLILLLGLFIELNIVYSQPTVRTDNYCEGNQSLLHGVLRTSESNSTVIVIARLGKGEASQKYSRRRLQVIKREFLKSEMPEEKLVWAFGEKTNGKGQVEIYVNGILELIFQIPTRENLKAGEC